MSDCSLLTPLRRDGTSQRQRMPAALDPRVAPVDGRTTADLLLAAGGLARLLRYYTETNSPKGDWREFIEGDITTVAARVGAYDGEAAQAEFQKLRDKASGASETDFPAAFAALVPPVFTLAQTFEAWRRGSIEGLQLRTRLDRLIEGVLAPALQDTIRAATRATDVGIAVTLPPAQFSDIWGDLTPQADLALFPTTPISADDRRAAVKAIAQSFERFHEAARRLAADAPRLLADTFANYPDHQPHMALFLAFLRLFNSARCEMNTLTGEHLDFYYREVLRLVPRGPIADRVHVLFELAKHAPPTLVAQDTELNAGKDATGVPLVYGTDAEIVVNHATLHPDHGLKTVFLDLAPDGVVRNVHAAARANAEAVTTLATGETQWPTFGSTALPFARLGLAIASPMLRLAEGTRTITVRFGLSSASNYFRPADAPLVRRELRHNVTFEFTGPKGWVAAQATVSNPAAGNFLEYVITLPASAPAVVGLDPKLHLETFDTRLPVLRIVLKNDGLPGVYLPDTGDYPAIADYSDETEIYHPTDLVRFEGHIYQPKVEIDHAGYRPSLYPGMWSRIEYACPYKYFARMQLQDLQMTVHAEGLRNLVLESDTRRLKPAKPFVPFGPVAGEGSALLVGSWEIFQKRLTDVTVHLTWAGLPSESFQSYYAQYPGSPVTGNDYFKVDVETLKDANWSLKVASNERLFDSAGAAPAATRQIQVHFYQTSANSFPADPDLPPIPQFQPGLARGFMRLKLKTGFLHDRYSAAITDYLAKKAIYAADQVATTHPATRPTDPVLPKPPFTPVVSDFTVDYTAQETINYATATRDEVENRVHRLFQIGPFGHQEFAPVPAASAVPGVEPARSPVPAFPFHDDAASAGSAEGTLYLGVSSLVPGQNLSLLFQMAEGSEDPSLPAQDVQWAYLTASGWKDFSRAEILLDTTNELIESGVVQVATPNNATSETTLLPAGIHWLRATVNRDTAAIPKAMAVLTQAVRASFRDGGNDQLHLATALPAGTISKLVRRESAIKSVSQPFSSFGARMPESDAAFRIRVAERLRHKRRAVTIFDYERLVLEHFPEVYKVRCLGHTSPDSEYAPGSVRVVVVPNLRNRNAVDPLRPRLSLSRLEAIRRDLAPIATDFADIEVVNPDYEEVHVSTDVRFRTGYDKGFYTGQLGRDIIRFLSPWLYDDGVDLTFGGRVHRSAILNYIEGREYVDFVANFTIDHVIAGESGAFTTLSDVEEAVPTRSSAVIVSSATHHIGDAIVSCVDEPAADEGPVSTPVTPAPSLPPGAARYLGNSHTRELHDLTNTRPQCQLDEIPIDRQYPVRRIEDAVALGYDFCAYCFGPGWSTR